jgi:hypothetical protein
LKLSRRVKLVVLLLVLTLGCLILVEDVKEEYTWIYPLETPLHIDLPYPKTTLVIAVVDLESARTNYAVYSGVPGSLTISSCATCYVAIIARGLNAYTALIVALVVMFTALGLLRVDKLSAFTVIALLVLPLAIMPLLHVYIKLGGSVGYYFEEYRVGPVRLENLELSTIQVGENKLLAFTYTLSDKIDRLSLISVRVREHEPGRALLLINASGNLTLANSKATLYLKPCKLEIRVLSEARDPNTTLEYYRLEFKQPDATTPYYCLLAAITLTALQGALVTYNFVRRLAKE